VLICRFGYELEMATDAHLLANVEIVRLREEEALRKHIRIMERCRKCAHCVCLKCGVALLDWSWLNPEEQEGRGSNF